MIAFDLESFASAYPGISISCHYQARTSADGEDLEVYARRMTELEHRIKHQGKPPIIAILPNPKNYMQVYVDGQFVGNR